MKFVTRIAAVAALAAAPTLALAEAGLPDKMTWTAYGTTASGYAQSVAIGNALQETYGTKMRVIPGKNDVSRMAPLRDGQADYCACGAAAYFGQEAAFLFASEEWGPQPLRVVMTAIGANGLALATAKDANITTMADLKGKRVSWVVAGDALNWNAAANMAFAGLTWDDVQKVEVSGFKASVDAIINGQSDAAFMSTVTPHAQRLAASPRGIHWPPLPHDDVEGWKRLNAAQPIALQHTITVGADLSADNPLIGYTYPYPILVTNAPQDADEVYALVKAIHSTYDKYKDAAPGAAGWALANQNLVWGIPYHDGAIRFYKEQGMWTDEAQANHDTLIKRQQIIADTWKSMGDISGMSPEDISAKWMPMRKKALEDAGMPVVFN
ncbi:MAG: TAXI family TRAP transporter solute-binding subunit [Minwuia sp.]|uniref:TAXI family TRAP transporter solute-binding subunit n=1 Tax=Minwuia sp. TaxID=2493630 RepID=UPI003A861CB1